MRTLVLGLAVAACLLLLAPDALASRWSFEDYLKDKARSDWEGYGVGSMTHRRVTQTVVEPGQPAPQKMVMEERKTLAKITETEYVIQVERREGGDWMVDEAREAKGDRRTHTIEDQGAATLTLGSTAYPCVKKKVTWKEGETVVETALVWIHAEKGVLKLEIRGERDTTLVVSKLDASWPVGGTTLKGRVLDMKMTLPNGLVFEGDAHMSMDVPGNVVRNAFKGSRGPVKIDVLIELLAFTKK